MRTATLILICCITLSALAQEPAVKLKNENTDSLVGKKPSPFNTGFYPILFFDVDLRYLVKYNNYEGFRLGFGGVTNDSLFDKFKIGGYVAHGFKDKTTKYSLGGSVRLNNEKNTWLSLYYADDIREIGTFNYLTDARVYSVFEPRLVNIIQFYKFKNWQTNIQHAFSPKILSEFRVSHSEIRNIENYWYLDNGIPRTNYELAEITAAVRISPKTNFFTNEEGLVEYFDGFPKISAQITKGIKGIAHSDFNYTNYGLKLDYYIKRTDLSSTNILLEGLLSTGNTPLTHLFHAYPNNPTKETIMQRFSVAGVQSFETMFFGEFFSDRLTTLQIKHSLRRFYISKRLKPELVFITRHALGNLKNKENHVGIPFGTLEQIYSETGFELNKLIFGFGTSFAYRYGYYSNPKFEDNISFKFTFYLKI